MENGHKAPEDKFQMILKAAMNVPSIRIVRSDFLQKQFSKKYSDDIVQKVILTNPATAGIGIEEIESISKSCIQFETNKVSAISVAAGIPGGLAMIGTVPADTIQYFAHVVRIVQKLIYLYGWDELYNSDGEFDDETMNMLMLFIGVMFGVNSATATVTKLANSMTSKVAKSLSQKTLTKGIIYPIVKNIAKVLGVKMTKDIYAKGVSKIIPIVGGALSGGLTYFTFKPLAVRLKKHLKTLSIANVELCKQNSSDEGIIYELEYAEVK